MGEQLGEGGGKRAAVLNRVVQGGLSEKLPLEPRPEGCKRIFEVTKETRAKEETQTKEAVATVCLTHLHGQNYREGASVQDSCPSHLLRALLSGICGDPASASPHTG